MQNPNGTIMYSTHEAELDLPQLPPHGHCVHVVTYHVLSRDPFCLLHNFVTHGL